MIIYEKNQKEYPRRLSTLGGMPEKLYGIGALPSDDKPSLAIVGARRCSHYGKNMAYEYAKVLSREGVQIISGMAMGVDAAAHAGALAGGGSSYAVLGCGTDICYPASSKKIYEEMKTRGGIWSELAPGTPPLPHHFPRRNRIISGLADAVLVVEAKEKSGSLITVDCALEQGRTVFALPGRVGDLLSEGCNRLIYQGAGAAWSPEIILEEMDWSRKTGKREAPEKEFPGLGLATEDDLVYSCLGLNPKTAGQLQEESGLPIGILMKSLIHLQNQGLADEVWKNSYIRGKDHRS